MILLTLIIATLALIIFLKANKIKELNKNLLKREAMFSALYEQRFESCLKLINLNPVNIQQSIFMDIGELRKQSVFLKLQEENSKFLELEEKIQSILNKVQKSDNVNNINNAPEMLEVTNHINSLNILIEETKTEYNNLIDDFNQETTDFFGKNISKKIKGLKKFNHI